jgi:sulfatase maturation enzyme AslB (radical SAM superfamily)
VSPEGYGRFLVDVFQDWVRRDIGTVCAQMFDTALANWVGVMRTWRPRTGSRLRRFTATLL